MFLNPLMSNHLELFLSPPSVGTSLVMLLKQQRYAPRQSHFTWETRLGRGHSASDYTFRAASSILLLALQRNVLLRMRTQAELCNSATIRGLQSVHPDCHEAAQDRKNDDRYREMETGGRPSGNHRENGNGSNRATERDLGPLETVSRRTS